ncbi:MAG: class I SAM-dependent methyltransferase [Halobacteriovoraceae bacterium]|nr:class I SAM-dependent methyltransferase [Halobacteriovoraceae bacterium]
MNDSKTKKDLKDHDLNTYEGIAEYYDTLMTGGYYDYSKIASNLCQILGERKRVLELGVGTGLVVENLLKANPALKITGVDNTQAMIEKAKERLGEKMEYKLQDVTQLELDQSFDAAFSVGGCWYFIDNGTDKELEFCSHIDDLEASLKGLGNVINHLDKGGVLAFALQSPHTDYTKELSKELSYSQEIFAENDGFTKHYAFTKGDQVIAEQFYRYLTFSESKIHKFFEELNCKPLGLCPNRNFFVYQKN